MARSTADKEFSDIRPYRDEECRPVLKRLYAHKELFAYLSQFAFPRVSKFSSATALWLCRTILGYKLRKVRDIASFQVHITGWFFFRMLRHTSAGIKIKLASPFKDQGQLLLSNHRDISVDPAVICYSLHLEKQQICMIGIGDNLLTNEYAADIMRLNRSFIVKRSLTDAREIYIEMRRLSAFIKAAVHEKESIWLAHREGRAKDGIDRTSQTVLKMLKLSCSKETSIAAALNKLNIRPVSISYEYDPCDIYKARVISEGRTKKENDSTDLRELIEGITGYKGRISVFIGKTMEWKEEDSIENITMQIDREIIGNYRLYPSHFYALYRLVQEEILPSEKLARAVSFFKLRQPINCPYLEKRIEQHIPSQWLNAYLYGYANPVLEKIKLSAVND